MLPTHKSRAREALEAVLFVAVVAVLFALLPFEARAQPSLPGAGTLSCVARGPSSTAGPA
jgi:hypothetical protein